MNARLLALVRTLSDAPAVLTQAKSFADNRVIGSRALNRLGLHVARVLLAHAVMRWRRLCLSATLSREDRVRFRRQGYLVKTDFLPPATFARLRAECVQLGSGARVRSAQGDTLTEQWLIDAAAIDCLPTLRATLYLPEFRRTLGYVAGRWRTPYHWLQRIRSYPGEATQDPQRTPHADSFQPSMKAWLFLSDADEASGPLTYVPGSHRLSGRRLRWEYRQSVIGRDLPEVYAARGSLRATLADLEQMGLPPPLALSCRRNTLIVADTFGFHCRGARGDENAQRLEIWSLSRSNPFNPFIGLPFRALDRCDWWLRRQFLALRRHLRRSRRGASASERPGRSVE